MSSENNISWEMQDKLTTRAHHAMALFAGYVIAYGILAKGTGLTSAMTLNLIDLVLAIMGKTPSEVLLRFLALVIYVSAVVLFTWMRLRTHINLEKISILLDAIAVAAVFLLPDTLDPIIIAYPLFFAFSFQYNAFPGCYGFGASTVFSSNNTRQTTAAFTEYILDGDQEYLKKGCFFLATIVLFHLGIAVSWIFVNAMGKYAAVISLIPLGYSFAHVHQKSYFRKNSENA